MMKRELLIVETDRVTCTWTDDADDPPVPVPGTWVASEVVATARRPGLGAITLKVGDRVTEGTADLRLFEQCDYHVHVMAKARDARVQLAHRDPVVLHGQHQIDGAQDVGVSINFGSQVGRTLFSVLVNGEPEFDLELEVSSTKLDYATDFEALLRDVQGMATGLVFAYLRSTYRIGVAFHSDRPSELEWILLLRHVAVDLGKALRFIAARPIRGLRRAVRNMPSGRVRRIDATMRRNIQRGRGRGPFTRTPRNPPLRSYLGEHRAEPMLDTVEHRWLAAQVQRCRHRVAGLLRAALEPTAAEPRPRQRQIARELEQLETQLGELAALEPLAAATGLPPPGFASLQLLGAPGYREAYQHCLILGLGLRIEGGLYEVTLKDLGTLYEYWCYLRILQIIAEETRSEIPARDLVTVLSTGLRVNLQKGTTSRVTLGRGGPCEIDLVFNPVLSHEFILVDQSPDILISLRAPDWPTMELVVDAKYRVTAKKAYLAANRDFAGPPPDALNALYRYRDAILLGRPKDEWVDAARAADNHALARPLASPARTQRSVIHAIAMYPGVVDPVAYQGARLWRAIEHAGIGAIPALPEHCELLRVWLRGMLTRGGWALAELAPRHAAIDQVHGWQLAASQPVLVAVLRGHGDQDTRQHLRWISDTSTYYLPVTESQPRQRDVRKIAFYMPAASRDGQGAITHVADVIDFEIRPRHEIETPWDAARPATERQIVYKLFRVRLLDQPIPNTTARGPRARMSSHRWTSLLGLSRAKNLHELMLETEPEWRLLERLDAHGAKVQFEPERVKVVDPDNPHGRAWFVVGDRRARFAGASGFLLEAADREARPFAPVDAAFRFLTDAKLGGT